MNPSEIFSVIEKFYPSTQDFNTVFFYSTEFFQSKLLNHLQFSSAKEKEKLNLFVADCQQAAYKISSISEASIYSPCTNLTFCNSFDGDYNIDLFISSVLPLYTFKISFRKRKPPEPDLTVSDTKFLFKLEQLSQVKKKYFNINVDEHLKDKLLALGNFIKTEGLVYGITIDDWYQCSVYKNLSTIADNLQSFSWLEYWNETNFPNQKIGEIIHNLIAFQDKIWGYQQIDTEVLKQPVHDFRPFGSTRKNPPIVFNFLFTTLFNK